MAAVCTHYVFASEYPDRHGDVIPAGEPDKNAVLWGTQGPDVFFFHRALPLFMRGRSLHGFGSELHRVRPSLFFDAVTEHMDAHPSRTLESYVAGLIMHYALDRRIHPFVFALQDRIVRERRIRYNPSIVHNFIEANIDIIVLREKLNVAASDFRPSDTLAPDKKAIGAASRLYSHVAERLKGVKYAPETIAWAFYDMRLLQRMLYDRSGRKRAVMRAVEHIPFVPPFFSSMMRTETEDKACDCANLSHGEWRALDDADTVRRDSVFDIYETAMGEARSLIKAILFDKVRGKDALAELTQEIAFDAGEKLKTEN